MTIVMTGLSRMRGKKTTIDRIGTNSVYILWLFTFSDYDLSSIFYFPFSACLFCSLMRSSNRLVEPPLTAQTILPYGMMILIWHNYVSWWRQGSKFYASYSCGAPISKSFVSFFESPSPSSFPLHIPVLPLQLDEMAPGFTISFVSKSLDAISVADGLMERSLSWLLMIFHR